MFFFFRTDYRVSRHLITVIKSKFSFRFRSIISGTFSFRDSYIWSNLKYQSTDTLKVEIIEYLMH